MTTIAILSEGRTDQKVIEQVLLGFFADHTDDLEIKAFFPSEVTLPGEPEEGGWTVLKRYLQSGYHLRALQLNDYVVIHIDTDRCEDKGYEVSRRDPNTGIDLEPDAVRKAAIARLLEWTGLDLLGPYGRRVLFAVAVDTIECWLLPLVGNEPAKQGKTTGCERVANHALKLAGRDSLSYGDKLRRYAKEAGPYRTRKTLMAKGILNPSLRAFLDELAERNIEIREG